MSSNNGRWAMNVCQEMAGDVKKLLSETPLEKGGYEKLNKYFKDHLKDKDIEYFVLMDQNYVGVVHTNPFREGMVFDDEVGKKTVDSNEPLTQLYHRDTGETLYDASTPIYIDGKKGYTLRVGVQKKEEVIFYKNFAAAFIPVVASGLTIWLGGFNYLSLIIGIILGFVVSGVAAYFLKKSHEKIINLTKEGMKNVINGNLTFHENNDVQRYKEVQKQDSFGQLALEANKLSMGLGKLIGDLINISSEVSKSSAEQDSSTDELQKATESVAANSEEVSSSAQEQEEAMREIANFMQKVSKNMNNLDGSMKKAVQAGEENANKGKEGSEAIEDSKNQMDIIRSSFKTSEEAIKDLEEKSEKIGTIINAITEISEQTNLLALNAAIEAARAGEHGKGFAVVAEEVSSLAENSNQSANEIMQIVKDTQNKIQEVMGLMKKGSEEIDKGNSVINETSEKITEIINSVQSTTEHIRENEKLTTSLAKDSLELEEKTTTINETVSTTSNAMQDIAATIEEQNAMTEEITANANNLAKVAKDMDKLIKRFQV
ncbi:methyl-accepting chemotaxis protein [Natranaerofaba carboxydovora]|uniref:methyl-accepting chemotaxis protein n=1 Tax=Natranaerofaba carboxydovora TaxID=2742683 RepID=UPI001F13E148|nr:methyl-accepting chemotaxis protein [Natranaerofaba carboxydovora]UMZ73790.1 Methyl-accepting chemotaxis protein McpB [Natranaerofaba carboxydovora]